MTTRHPWLPRPDESGRAYQAFEVYRDMGPDRSLERLAQAHTAAIPTVKAWSARFDWQARVRAFDEAAAAKAAVIALEDAATVRARQAQHAKVMQLRAMQKIAGTDPDAMTVGEATRAWQVGAEAERKALGIADKLEHSGPDGGPIKTESAVTVTNLEDALALLDAAYRDTDDH